MNILIFQNCFSMNNRLQTTMASHYDSYSVEGGENPERPIQMTMKYLIVQTPDGETPIIFPKYMYHDHFEEMLGGPEVIAAGEVDLIDGKIRCSGKSFALGIMSRGADDEVLIVHRLTRTI